MNLKQFLKLNWKKILLTIIFVGFSYFLKTDCLPPGMLGACENYGFPMPYLNMGSGDFVYFPQYSILWLGLIVDLIFWYFISFIIISVFKRLKNRF